ncbi:hypothetical protein ABZ912_52990 [Nonomuraea angiospora]|uniref:hypothetical protein n=1 Tax=Nonomuraea angiospora TaxID=46172 RepID=UPI00340E78AA
MTQVTPLPAWQELRDLVTEGRTADLADRVIALDESERPEVARRSPVGGSGRPELGPRRAASDGVEAVGVVTCLPPDGRY